MRAAILAVSAMICVTACNKREAAAEKAREATEEARKETEEAARAQAKAAESRQDAREASAEAAAKDDYTRDKDGRLVDRKGRYVNNEGHLVDKDGRLLDKNGKVINGETPPMRKIREEARQTSRDVGEAVGRSGDKVKEESRQTARDVSEAVKGDRGKTEADKQVSQRVRESLKANKNLAADANNIHISTVNGEVNLSGTVATAEIAKSIGQAAASVAGVTKVDNDLKAAERVGTGTEKD